MANMLTSITFAICLSVVLADSGVPDDVALVLTTLGYSFFVIGVGAYFTFTNPAFHSLKLKGVRRHSQTLFDAARNIERD